MLEILKTLKDTPLPSILVIGGIAFLLLTFIRKVGSNIELEPEKKGLAGFIGFILLCIGIGLYLIPGISFSTSETPPENENQSHKQSPLVINGASYSMPDPNLSPYCVAQEVHTNSSNIVDYEVSVPSGWVMMWSSWKATWDGGNYNKNGLLIIKGPYNGKIQINTGGSCSGPIEWYDFIYQNRIDDYPVSSRPEYNIP